MSFVPLFLFEAFRLNSPRQIVVFFRSWSWTSIHLMEMADRNAVRNWQCWISGSISLGRLSIWVTFLKHEHILQAGHHFEYVSAYVIVGLFWIQSSFSHAPGIKWHPSKMAFSSVTGHDGGCLGVTSVIGWLPMHGSSGRSSHEMRLACLPPSPFSGRHKRHGDGFGVPWGVDQFVPPRYSSSCHPLHLRQWQPAMLNRGIGTLLYSEARLRRLLISA